MIGRFKNYINPYSDLFPLVYDEDSIQYINKVANDLALPIHLVRDCYFRFHTVGLRGGLNIVKLRYIFESICMMGKAWNVSSKGIRQMFSAVEQAINKGTVSIDELKMTFANYVPLALPYAQKAMQETDTDPNFSGNILSVETLPFLPKWAEYLNEAFKTQSEIMADTASGQIQRAKNAFVQCF